MGNPLNVDRTFGHYLLVLFLVTELIYLIAHSRLFS